MFSSRFAAYGCTAAPGLKTSASTRIRSLRKVRHQQRVGVRVAGDVEQLNRHRLSSLITIVSSTASSFSGFGFFASASGTIVCARPTASW